MSFLLDLGIEENVINFLNETLLEEEKIAFIMNSDNIISSINYLKNIGVNDTTIGEILCDDYTVLMPGQLKLKKAVSKMDKEQFIQKLNENIDYIKFLRNF